MCDVGNSFLNQDLRFSAGDGLVVDFIGIEAPGDGIAAADCPGHALGGEAQRRPSSGGFDSDEAAGATDAPPHALQRLIGGRLHVDATLHQIGHVLGQANLVQQISDCRTFLVMH